MSPPSHRTPPHGPGLEQPAQDSIKATINYTTNLLPYGGQSLQSVGHDLEEEMIKKILQSFLSSCMIEKYRKSFSIKIY